METKRVSLKVTVDLDINYIHACSRGNGYIIAYKDGLVEVRNSELIPTKTLANMGTVKSIITD